MMPGIGIRGIRSTRCSIAVHLIHQGRGLQRVPGCLAPEIALGKPAQFGVDGRHQCFES